MPGRNEWVCNDSRLFSPQRLQTMRSQRLRPFLIAHCRTSLGRQISCCRPSPLNPHPRISQIDSKVTIHEGAHKHSCCCARTFRDDRLGDRVAPPVPLHRGHIALHVKVAEVIVDERTALLLCLDAVVLGTTGAAVSAPSKHDQCERSEANLNSSQTHRRL